MRLCKDCRWAKPDPGPPHIPTWTCFHPSSLWQAPPDLVTGTQEPATQITCHEARCHSKDPEGSSDWCGPDGKFWEPIGFGPPAQSNHEKPQTDVSRAAIYSGRPRGL